MMEAWMALGILRPSRIKVRIIPLAILLSFGAALLVARAETTVAPPSNSALMLPAQPTSALQFPRPASIEPNIKFWVDVFASYSERDFIVHDKDDVWKIYQVLHIPGDGSPTRDDVNWANTYLKTKYADMLNRLAQGNQPATYEEQSVAKLFKGERNPNFAAAAQNLRVQQGMAERFRETLVRARLYLPRIESVFHSFGLPQSLALLPTVESGFHRYVCSKAGAMGIWQFTRSTGKEYMTVTSWHDDRLDPSKATEAAAQLLLHNHDVLGSWPLAITAYNYGTGGMMQAVEATGGGDYCQILRRWDGPRFGFASKNYYSEFLAAVQVYQYRQAYFPGIDEEQPDYAEDVPPPPVYRVHYVSRHHSARYSVRRASTSSRGRHRLRRAMFRTRSRRRLRSA
jgi:peptidoglycan lytic transglycosylase D